MASEETVPLIPGTVKEEATVVQAMEGPAKRRSFIFQRVTYYWILVVSQFFQATLCIGAFAISVADRKTSPDKAVKDRDINTLVSGIYSIFTLMYGLIILVSHYNGSKSQLNAGRHVAFARGIIFGSILNFVLMFRPVMVAYAAGQISNDIQRFLVPVVVILFWVTSLAALAASYLTKRTAVHALGTAMVNDPDYRVPAWTLAKTVDEGGIQLA